MSISLRECASPTDMCAATRNLARAPRTTSVRPTPHAGACGRARVRRRPPTGRFRAPRRARSPSRPSHACRSRICRSRSLTLARAPRSSASNSALSSGSAADAHGAGLGHLVDREIDVLATVVGERESRRAIEPWQHGLAWHVVAAAPRGREDVGREVLGVLSRTSTGEVAYERSRVLADDRGEPPTSSLVTGESASSSGIATSSVTSAAGCGARRSSRHEYVASAASLARDGADPREPCATGRPSTRP